MINGGCEKYSCVLFSFTLFLYARSRFQLFVTLFEFSIGSSTQCKCQERNFVQLRVCLLNCVEMPAVSLFMLTSKRLSLFTFFRIMFVCAYSVSWAPQYLCVSYRIIDVILWVCCVFILYILLCVPWCWKGKYSRTFTTYSIYIVSCVFCKARRLFGRTFLYYIS